MAANETVAKEAPTEQQRSQAGVPKRFVEGQTVCNEKNEKGKLCNGHLKQVRPINETARRHLRGDDLLYKCQTCGTLYMGPPLGHVRDPRQRRYVEYEQNLILQAAGGTLPAIVQNERGAYVMLEPAAAHAPAPTAPAAAPKLGAPAAAAKPAAAPKAAPPKAAPAQSATANEPPAPDPVTGFIPYVPPPAPGPVPGETEQQKLARLRAIVAEAKRRKELAGGVIDKHATGARTTPAAASTSGTDSSAAADAHRPAAEAQAATGQASAAPLSPAAATASPAAGAETVADLAPEASTELTPGAPPAAAPTTGAKPKARTATGTVTRMDYDAGPTPGETQEQKIARLRAVVAEAKRRAGKE
jgi:histone H1/5